MWNYLWPILTVVLSNTVYHISAKVMPKGVHPFVSLTITYVIAAVASVILFLLTGGNTNFIAEIKKVNWTSLVLGISVVGLEFGYLQVYRAGWDLSVASLVSNIGLAVLLIAAGVLLFRETFHIRQVIGIVICLIGIVVLNY